jgi:hypothetical protein
MVNGYNIGVGGKGRVFYRIVQRIKIRLGVFNGELWGLPRSTGNTTLHRGIKPIFGAK